MDRKKVLTFAAFLLLLYLRACPQCLDLDIIVLGDYSGSVQGSEQYVFDAFESFSNISTGERNIRVGLILFNDESETIVPITKNHSILYNLPHDRQASGSTDIENAIQQGAIELLKEQNNSRKLIILISDGNNTSRPEFMRLLANNCYVETDYENLSVELAKLDVCL